MNPIAPETLANAEILTPERAGLLRRAVDAIRDKGTEVTVAAAAVTTLGVAADANGIENPFGADEAYAGTCFGGPNGDWGSWPERPEDTAPPTQATSPPTQATSPPTQATSPPQQTSPGTSPNTGTSPSNGTTPSNQPSSPGTTEA